MAFAIALSRQNVKQKTGGPFGAAIFERDTGKLVSIGVNQVVALNAAAAHAEVLALTLAQQALGSFTLGNAKSYDLVTSAQMCAMCCGAVSWSGVRRVFYGATSTDVETIVGFDEGPIHPNWIAELQSRGIEAIGPLLQEEARSVLRLYAENEGIIYNR